MSNPMRTGGEGQSSHVRLIEVHGNNEARNANIAAHTAMKLSPGSRVISVRSTQVQCNHDYIVFAVRLTGTRPTSTTTTTRGRS